MILLTFLAQFFKNKNKTMPCITMCIDGNIAAGKSTLLSALRQRMGAQKKYRFLHEPVDRFCQYKEFNPLQLAYLNPHVYSSITQLHILQEIKEFYSEKLSSDRLYVTDRSLGSTVPFINAQYHHNYISEFEKVFLKDRALSWSQKFPVNKHLFISCPPRCCFERVQARKRKEETPLSLYDLEIIDQYYQEYIKDLISEKGLACIKVLPFDDPQLVEQAYSFLLDA